MSSIAPGLGGTFKQRSIEGRLLEVLFFMALAEADDHTNPEYIKGVKGSVDSEKKVFSGNYSIPAQESTNESGEIVIKAVPYLQGISIEPGADNPTFKSLRPEAYLLEVLKRIQFLERNPAKNPQQKRAIRGTYDSDLELYQGSFELPITIALGTDGAIVIFAKEYLDV
ncbi:MAG TPA: hypothetical protein V6D10_05780 [Trichocoleus sp.]|jgi:hypothetical protein